jgi:hypothetical protein
LYFAKMAESEDVKPAEEQISITIKMSGASTKLKVKKGTKFGKMCVRSKETRSGGPRFAVLACHVPLGTTFALTWRHAS